MTMPGSLFPRTTSLEPESASEHSDNPDEHHVRFAPGILSPPRNRIYESQVVSPTNAKASSSSLVEAEIPSPSTFRPRSIPSVKAAVQKFRVGPDDADSSILLPQLSPKRNKGQTRDNASRSVLSNDNQHDTDESSRISYRAKGKGRASNVSLERFDGDTSGDIRVRGKERELVAAREEQMRNERRWEREKDTVSIEESQRESLKDKERIRMLESEIQRLRDEVRFYFSHIHIP